MLPVENTPAHPTSKARNRTSRSKAPISLKSHANFEYLVEVLLALRSICAFHYAVCIGSPSIQTSTEEGASLAAEEPAQQRFYAAIRAAFAKRRSAAPGYCHRDNGQEQQEQENPCSNGGQDRLRAAMCERCSDEWPDNHHQHHEQAPTASQPGAASHPGRRWWVGAIKLLIHRLLSGFSVLKERRSSSQDQHIMPDKQEYQDMSAPGIQRCRAQTVLES